MTNKIKIEILSILPTVYSNKCKAFCVSVHDDYKLQEQEYPQEIQANKEKISQICQQLAKEMMNHGNKIEIRLINPLSLRGIWLMTKHKLGNGTWVIMNASRDLKDVKDEIINSLAEILKITTSS